MNTWHAPSRSWKTWLFRSVAAVVCGAIFGSLAVYRTSPYFLSIERLLAKASETQQSLYNRDHYLLLVYTRLGDQIFENQYRFMIPLLIPPLVRAGHFEDIGRLLDRLSPKELLSPSFIDGAVELMSELARTDDLPNIQKYTEFFTRRWQSEVMVDKYVKSFALLQTNAALAARMDVVTSKLEAMLMNGPLASDNPDFLEFIRLLEMFPPETPDALLWKSSIAIKNCTKYCFLFSVRSDASRERWINLAVRSSVASNCCPPISPSFKEPIAHCLPFRKTRNDGMNGDASSTSLQNPRIRDCVASTIIQWLTWLTKPAKTMRRRRICCKMMS